MGDGLEGLLRDMGESPTPRELEEIRLGMVAGRDMEAAAHLWALLAGLRAELGTVRAADSGARWPEGLGGAMPLQ